MPGSTKQSIRQRTHISRYWRILMVLSNYHLEEVLQYIGLQRLLYFRFVWRGNPWRKVPYTKPERVRMAIEDLGTTFVKLGQIFSTRSDILPPNYIQELSKLQNCLTPLPVEVMKKAISEELGHPPDSIFASFDSGPIGVASIGQVYACVMPDGKEAVVKVRKPGVPQIIEEDMYILHRSAQSAMKHWKDAEQYGLVGVVEEVANTLKTETDYIQEAHNAEYLARFFQDDPRVHIPKIYWEASSSGVITMERVHGIGILDIEALDRAGFDRKELAKRAVGLWLKMIFEAAAFHADPHPGNLFVEHDGRLALIDFGMVPLVDDEVRWHLAYALKAILDRNVDLLIDELQELGAVSLAQEGSRTRLRKDLKYAMARFSTLNIGKGRALPAEINLDQLFTVLRANRIQLPSNTFLLLKTIVMVQSLGKGLDPEFNMFPMLEAGATQIFKDRFNVITAFRKSPSAAAELANLAAGLPGRLDRMLKTVERGELLVRTDVSDMERHIHRLERIVIRTVIGLIIGALILGTALWLIDIRLIHP